MCYIIVISYVIDLCNQKVFVVAKFIFIKTLVSIGLFVVKVKLIWVFYVHIFGDFFWIDTY